MIGSPDPRLNRFRHSFATLLKAKGEDVKVVQESLRHANCRIAMDVYAQRLDADEAPGTGPRGKILIGPTSATLVAAIARKQM